MKKRLLSALLTVGMLLTLVPAAFAAGDAAPSTPTTPSIVPAKLHDNANLYADDALYVTDSYTVTPGSTEGDVQQVTINIDGLKKHANAPGLVAYWAGFAVAAPEGATQMKVSSGSDLDAVKDALPSVSAEAVTPNCAGESYTDPGFAAYLNVKNEALDGRYFAIQWMSETEGTATALGGLSCYQVKFGTITLAEEQPVHPAILADRSETPGQDLCTGYEVKDKQVLDVENGGYYTEVAIQAKDLRSHKNANDRDGYWIGFAVAAPEGADSMKYAFSTSREELSTLTDSNLEQNVVGDQPGIAFYANAGEANVKTWARVQWLNTNGGTILDDTIYHMDLSGVALALPADAPTIMTATLHDNSTENAIPDDQLFTEGSYKAELIPGTDGSYDVALAAKQLRAHANGQDPAVYGFWIGFGVVKPENAASYAYTIGTQTGTSSLDDLNGSQQGAAIYFDAAKGPKDVTIQWKAASGVAVGSPLTFHVDLSQVELYLPTVETAKLHDNSTENAIPDDQLFTEGSYSAAVKAGADGVYDVVLTADQLKEHANGQDPAVYGFWIGFAVAAPDGAERMKVAFATDKAGLAALTESDLEPNVIGDKSGVAFYANASAGADAKTWAQVQWLDTQGNVLSSTVYHIDLSAVTLAIPEDADAPEIVTAKLHDTSSALQDDQLYTKDSYTADLISQNIDGSYNVALAAKQLREHVNGQGTRGHWIGFELAAPTGATQFKVNDGDAEALEVLPNDRQGVAFYFNASDLSARTLTLTWLNDEDQTVGSPLTFHVDLSQVEKYVAPSHGGGGGGGGGGGSTTPTTPTDSTTPTDPTTKGFSDVAKNDWFADSVAYVVDKGLMQGTSATTFAPNATTTRGMIVTILHRLEGTPSAAVSAFTDVSRDAWYAAAVDWAAANGIVNGTSATTFAPNDPITREQLAAILYRYAAFKGYDTTKLADLAAYRDAASISAYAKDAMAWANAAGLISGVTPDTLAPTGSATRAQVATILMRLCETVIK